MLVMVFLLYIFKTGIYEKAWCINMIQTSPHEFIKRIFHETDLSMSSTIKMGQNPFVMLFTTFCIFQFGTGTYCILRSTLYKITGATDLALAEFILQRQALEH